MKNGLKSRHILRRILATFTIGCILATGSGPFGTIQIAKAEENRIAVAKRNNWKYQNPLDVFYAGKLNDFNIHGEGYINVHDTFGCDFTVPVSAFNNSDESNYLNMGFDLFLFSASDNISLDSIIQAYVDSDNKKLIPITWKQQKQSFDKHKNGFTFESDNLTLDEFLGLPASGYYRFVAFVYEKNPFFSTKNNPQEPIPTTLTVSRKAFPFSNPADGGDPGEEPYEDPYEGAYNTVNVTCYAGEQKLKDTVVTVYSSDGQICFGTAPCAVPVGIEVALDLNPIGVDSFFTEEYCFPRIKKGDPIITTMPANGEIVIDLDKIDSGAVISGHVTDENGAPVANAYVSASRKDQFGCTTGIYTDDSGFYTLQGLYSKGYVISASKEQFTASSTEISEFDMISQSEINADFVLREKNVAFSLKFTGNINEDLYNILVPELLKSALLIKDNLCGDFIWSATDTVSFIPDTEKDIRKEYQIIIDTDYALIDSINVAEGTTVEVPLANLAGIRGSSTYKNLQYGHPRLVLFDEKGDPKFDFQGESNEYAFIVVLPEDENTNIYNAVTFGSQNRSPFTNKKYDTFVAAYDSKIQKKAITLEAGKVTYMGNAEVEVFDFDASTFHILSSINVSGTVKSSGDVLKITGHIEDLDSFKFKALHIYGYKDGESDLLTAAYKANSLVINGHLADAELENSEEWSKIGKTINIYEDVTGPFDFSCYLSALVVNDMIIRVEADVEKNGELQKDLYIGEFYAKVFPITLKTMHRTCTGTIKCSGRTSKNARVMIWEGETLLKTVEADDYGIYEALIQLPTKGRDYSFHNIHATSDGYSTDEVIIYYDKETTAVESISLEGGKTMETWTESKSFRFEALVCKPEMMLDEGEFNVLCSNGTMLSIPVESKSKIDPYDVTNRTLFKSAEYPFGNNKLVPVKVWFVYSCARRTTSESADVGFYSEDKPVYASGNQGAMSVGGEIIQAPAVSVTYDVVNELIVELLNMYPQYSKLGAALDKIGIGDMVELYNQVSEKIQANQKKAMVADDLEMLSFMNKIVSELSKDADTARYKNAAGVAREEGYRAMEMIDAYRKQSFYLGIANTIVSKIPMEFWEFKAVGIALQGIISPAMEEVKAHNDETWSFFNENMTDARRRFQLLTGLSTPELLDMLKKYKAGELTDYEIRKLLEKRLRGDDKNAESEDSVDLIINVDPSGFVYEAVASNRIENAVVTLYSEGMDYWEAEAYGQINPLISDAEGKYAWDVPEGNWFVKVFKQGYEEGSSANDPAAVVTIAGVNYLPVLPPQLDVNIPLISLSKPVATIEKIGNDLCLVFSKYVIVDTVTAENVKFTGFSASEYMFTALDAEISPAHTPVCGGKNLGRTFKIEFTNGNTPAALTAEISAEVMGYNDVSARGKALYDNGEEKNESDDTIPVDEKFITPEEEKKSKAGVIVWIVIGVIVMLGGVVTFIIVRKRKRMGKTEM